MTQAQEARIRTLAKRQSKVRITSRRRSLTGFDVSGPDGKTENVPTFAEASTKLLIRMQVFEVPPAWEIKIAKR